MVLEGLDDFDGSDCLDCLEGGLMAESRIWEGARSIIVSVHALPQRI